MSTSDAPWTQQLVALPTSIEALRERLPSETLLETISLLLDSIQDAVVLVGVDGRVIYQNANAEKLLGSGPYITSPEHWPELFGIYHLDGRTLYKPEEIPLNKAIHGIETPGFEMLIRPRTGAASRLIRGMAKPLSSGTGEPIGAMCSFHDATEHDRLRRQIRYRELHDGTSGVQNGMGIRQTIDAMLRDLRDGDVDGFGLLLVNLDRFGLVNHVIGRDAADVVLRRIGRMLQNRDRVIAVGRLCADEFVVVVATGNLSETQQQANEIIFALRTMDLTPSRYNTTITASVGTTWIGTDLEFSTEDILALLTTAVEDAKSDGRNRSIPVELEELTQPSSEHCRVGDVISIINEDRLCLFAEPIVQADRNLLGVEVLTRVCSESKPPTLPKQFLPTAERFGLIGQLDVLNLIKLVTWMGRQQSESALLGRVHINLSGYTLANESCFGDWMTVMLANIAHAPKITVEVTETFAMKKPVEASAALQQIRQLGCKIALDDFGAGYSSFSRLKQLPLDYLKIDGSLVRNFLEDKQDRAILKAIVQLGDALELPLIAEHAHNQELVQAMFSLGIDYVQGYGIGRGRPLTRCRVKN